MFPTSIERAAPRAAKGLALTLMLAFGALTAAGVQAQTRGGTLRTIVQPEPPMLMLGLNQQSPTQLVAGKIYESLLTWSPDMQPLSLIHI